MNFNFLPKQVVFCSIEELLQNIDKSELTKSLNGELVYDHEEWIQQRIVILCYAIYYFF